MRIIIKSGAVIIGSLPASQEVLDLFDRATWNKGTTLSLQPDANTAPGAADTGHRTNWKGIEAHPDTLSLTICSLDYGSAASRLQQVKAIRQVTGLSLRSAVEIRDAAANDERRTVFLLKGFTRAEAAGILHDNGINTL